MATRTTEVFATIRTEGGLLPADFLQRIAQGEKQVEGLTPDAYHLAGNLKINEAISQSWNVLRGAWQKFQDQLAALPDKQDAATTVTRDRWLLPLFHELGYGRLVYDRSSPISHPWHHVPIHLVGARVDINKPVVSPSGGPRTSPHSVVQDFLNRHEGSLWGIVSNGLTLRLLRDNASLTRQAYVEFDLESMMEGEQFADFAVLWLVCHQSRLEGDKASQCWLEKWFTASKDQGVRVLEQLRGGVEDALTALGRGFLRHSDNTALKDKLRSGALDKQDYFRQLLRVVYRLLFLFVAEDRELLFDPKAPAKARERYSRFYSTARLRRLARRRPGGPHADLWAMLERVFQGLADPDGLPSLGLPALGSFLWSPAAIPDLNGCSLANRDLLDAIRNLAVTADNKVRRIVDYRNLGTEELGSVYESLLELHPQVNLDGALFELKSAAGNERKTTGSYYTPHSLVQCLLDSALDPVMDQAVLGKTGEDVVKALLDLKICDPACGSGHFVIAAAHRLAKRVAMARTGEPEPPPEAIRHALRDVIGRCIYGVDLNPMAAELCRVSLWLEAMEPGKPLSFLDHHIRVGNSLLGATPELVAAGIPDEAFDPIEGDDKTVCREAKKQSKEERTQLQLFHGTQTQPWERLGNLPAADADLDRMADASPADIRAKEIRYAELTRSTGYINARFLYDAWCAAFVWKKCKPDAGGFDYCLTNDILRRIERNPHDCPVWVCDEVRRLAAQYQFLHWHLEFPDVFQPLENRGAATSNDWKGGFDVILGNPPWERVKLEEKQWFQTKMPEIADAQTAAIRKQMIRDLETTNPALLRQFQGALRVAEAESRFLRASGRFVRSGVGDVNTFAVFTELATDLIDDHGMSGIIIPTGLLTDDQLKGFSSYLVESGRLAYVYGFENEEFLFPGIANVVRFCAVAIAGPGRPASSARMAFYMRKAEHLSQEERFFSLSPADLARLNPKTRTCPIFRTKYDAELTLKLYERFPLLRPSDPVADGWGVTYLSMFHMANDSGLFLTEASDEALPLYEAKLFWHYDHRFGSYDLKGKLKGKGGRGLPDMPLELHQDPNYSITTQFWVERAEVASKVEAVWSRQWFIAYRTVSSAKLERTIVCAALPIVAANHKAPLILPRCELAQDGFLLLSCLNSIVLDYVARQKVGGTDIGYFHRDQLPLPRPRDYTEAQRAFLKGRVLELTYAAWDMQPFSRDLGYEGPPFRWDPDRRFQIQCEIDAFYAHFYGLTRDELLFILDPHELHGPDYPGESFRVLKEKETERFGSFITRDTVLSLYDQMAEANLSNAPYQSALFPPPGPPVDGAGRYLSPGAWSNWPSHIHGADVGRVEVKPRVPHNQFYAFADVIQKDDKDLLMRFEAAPRAALMDLPADGQTRLAALSELQNYMVNARIPYRGAKSMPLLPLEETWYRMDVAPGGFSASFSDGATDAILGTSPVRLSKVKREELSAILARIRLPDPDPEGRAQQVLSGLPAVRACFVAVYHVGQGLCTALCDAATGQPLVYFDFGAGCFPNHETRPPSLRFCFSRKPPIILSHWDSDHFMGARLLDTQALSANWIAPSQEVGPVTAAFAAALSNRGKLILLPRGVALGRFAYGETVACTGTTRNDSGLATYLEFPADCGSRMTQFTSSDSGRAPKSVIVALKPSVATSAPSPAFRFKVLLPGDAKYEFIPQILSRSFHGLVATHHGAAFGSIVPSAISDDPVQPTIALSYGHNNSYGHPIETEIGRCVAAGWQRRLDTVNGHAALGCPAGTAVPVLACGGSNCDLALVQT